VALQAPQPLKAIRQEAVTAALALCVFLFPIRVAGAKGLSPEEIRGSVVRVEVSLARHDWNAPWKLLPLESASGSAFLIAGDRFLTNAHVVRDAQQVTVKRNDGTAPVLATVDAIDNDCDLALLRVSSKTFLSGMRALPLGDLPSIGSHVVTYGYPLGGAEMSTTAGVVSRFESRSYSEGAQHLVVQTDAPLNPGNSGGPVVQGAAVVGVAFQILRNEQSIGFFIPAPIVRHFLEDGSDGHYDGFPEAPLRVSALNSSAYRRERKLPDDHTGVIVQEVAPGSSLDGVLGPGDVILSIDDHTVSDDGSWLSGQVRLPFGYLFDVKSIGQTVHFTVWREAKAQTVEWKASRFPPWTRLRRSGDPRYLVYAGVLFVPVTLEYLAAVRATGPARTAVSREVFYGPWESAPQGDREIVVVANVFRHPVNARLQAPVLSIVERVNGRPIRSLSELNRALDESQGPYDVFEFGPFGHVEALDRDRARTARSAILTTYGIRNDKSL
jgi:S1-C subfamily serine protease